MTSFGEGLLLTVLFLFEHYWEPVVRRDIDINVITVKARQASMPLTITPAGWAASCSP